MPAQTDPHSVSAFPDPQGSAQGPSTCAVCGHQEQTRLGQACSLCGGEMLDPLPALINLGIDMPGPQASALAVHRLLAQYLRQCDIRFTYGGTPLTAEQLLQPEALLPVIALDAMRLWQTLEHRPGTAPRERDSFGIAFARCQGSFFPLAAHPPAIGPDATSALRLLVFVSALRRVLGLKEGQSIELAPYIALWDQLDWTGEFLPDLPIPEEYDAQYAQKEFSAQRASTPRPVAAPAPVSPVANPFHSQQGGV